MTEVEPRARAWVEVDLDAIQANASAILRHVGEGCDLVAVVKANAYGHGLIPSAKAALAGGATWLAVAAVSEALALRAGGLAAPILLLCPFAPEEADTLVNLGVTPTVGDVDAVRALADAARTCGVAEFSVHLEVDTGIGRSGVQPEEAVALWRMAAASGLHVAGLCTHFAAADETHSTLTVVQDRAFDRTLHALNAAGARFDHLHLYNSPAVLRFPSNAGTLVRPGLLLYGIQPVIRRNEEVARVQPLPSSPPFPVTPALSLFARVGSVRELPAGHPISYGATYRMERAGRVATVLIGYGDGYPRRLSNRGHVLLHGQRAPVLGRVCMDQTVVDVTEIPGVSPGDVAVCLGAQGGETLSVAELALQIDATEHEITTGLSARLPRIYRGDVAGREAGAKRSRPNT